MSLIDYTRLLSRLDPKPDGEAPVRHRSALVDAVNSDGTADIILSGVVVPGVSVLFGAQAAVGEAVQVVSWGGDLLVLGEVRPSIIGGPRGILGYGETTANVGSITAGSVTLASALSVIVPPSRWIKLTGAWRSVLTTVAGDRARFRIVSALVYMEQLALLTNTIEQEGGTITATFNSGAGGTLSFLLQAARHSGTGTLTVTASTSAPMSILVEDLGPV